MSQDCAGNEKERDFIAKKKYTSKNVVMTGNNSDLHLIADIRVLIESARIRIAGAVNADLTMLYWRVGKRIREDILKERRASYGEEIVVTVSQKLAPLYGKGFDVKNL